MEPLFVGSWALKLITRELAAYFTCDAVGMVLRELAEAHPDRRITVLCGHTHGAGEAQILDNLRVLTGGAEYRHPEVQRVLDLS